MNWRSIDTVPKDGTPVILYDGEEVMVGVWEGTDDYPWTYFDPENTMYFGAPLGKMVGPEEPGGPTNWMPLPEPPTEMYCRWAEDGGLTYSEGWDTECGNRFVFTDGGPTDNGMIYCCYCGKQLSEVEGAEPTQQEEGGE